MTTANGTHPTPPSNFRDPTDPPDQQYVPDSWAPLLAGLRWLDEQYNLGAFEAYRGEHVAALDRTVMGHGRSLQELCERIARGAGVPEGRVATVSVHEPLFAE